MEHFNFTRNVSLRRYACKFYAFPREYEMKSPLQRFLTNLDFSIDIILVKMRDIRFFPRTFIKIQFNDVYFFENNFKNRRLFRACVSFSLIERNMLERIKKTTWQIYTKSVIKLLEGGYIKTGMGNNFSNLMQVGNRNLQLLRLKRFAHGTDKLIFQSSLHFPSPLRGKERGLIFHQFAETEKSYLRFSLSPAWNLRRRLISRRINLPSKPGAHPPHEPLHWHAPRFLQLVLFARIIRTHFRVKILPIPARTNIFHTVHSTNTSATV